MSKSTKRDLICKSCIMEIEKKDDLVTAFDAFEIVAFHTACYSNELKGYKNYFVSNQPINSISFNIKAGLMGLVGVVLILVMDVKFFGILLMITPLIRLYSWLKLERYLDN